MLTIVIAESQHLGSHKVMWRVRRHLHQWFVSQKRNTELRTGVLFTMSCKHTCPMQTRKHHPYLPRLFSAPSPRTNILGPGQIIWNKGGQCLAQKTFKKCKTKSHRNLFLNLSLLAPAFCFLSILVFPAIRLWNHFLTCGPHSCTLSDTCFFSYFLFSFLSSLFT